MNAHLPSVPQASPKRLPKQAGGVVVSRPPKRGVTGRRDTPSPNHWETPWTPSSTLSPRSSEAQATVHKQIRDEIVKGDADLICGSFNRTVVQWWTDLNFNGAKPPKVWRKTQTDEDLAFRAERDQKIHSLGFRPTKEYLTQIYGKDYNKWQQAISGPSGNDSAAFAEEISVGKIGFDVDPEEAMRLFENKGLKPTFAWPEHLADFKKTLIPKLQDAGWWGRKDVVDPKTGRVIKAQLGSARRLETIFRTNLQTAYSAGHWANAQATKAALPFLMYDAVDDTRTRHEHKALDQVVLPVDDPFWNTHYPPNGWNCRCGVIQMSQQDLEAEGLKPSKRPQIKKRLWKNPRTGKWRRIPKDLDAGWDYNPGKSGYHDCLTCCARRSTTCPFLCGARC